MAKIYSENRISLQRYTLCSRKIQNPVRIAVAADLHSASYGEGNRGLASLILDLQPDLVLLPGDTDDGVKSIYPALQLLQKLTPTLPCYLTLGNHELLLRRERATVNRFKRAGAVVLQGENTVFEAKNGQKLLIAGVPDYWCQKSRQSQGLSMLKQASKGIGPRDFGILLAHRPEKFPLYLSYPFELAVCGHAHGGQWRVPGLINGVYAPGQGLLPRYAGGLYDHEGKKLLVSRGLALGNTWVPRIFNPPELCLLELLPKAVDK